MKVTIDLPEDLVHAIKLRAVLERRSLKDLMAQQLRQIMTSSSPTSQDGSSPTVVVEKSLPVIRCEPDAPASRMTVEELLALEAEATIAEDRRHAEFPH